MRKKVLFLLLLTAAAATLWLLRTPKPLTEENDFAIADTATISKIFLADRQGNQIELDRKENTWMVNNQYKVRPSAMKILLKTIKNIRVQRPVSESSFNHVIKDLATEGVKVEIYQQSSIPTKTYTIGNNTPDHLGTFMLLDGAKQPFITHIPGFNGNLGPRYGIQGQILDISTWRDKTIFQIPSEEISFISLIFSNYNDSSFSIIRKDNQLELLDAKNNKIESQQAILQQYFSHFAHLNCEAIKDNSWKEKALQQKHLYTLVVGHHNKTDSLEIFQTHDNQQPIKEEDNYSVERMYAILNHQEPMLIQQYVFNKVLISIYDLQLK